MAESQSTESKLSNLTGKGVFVRESTGLVKNVSFLDAITLNISNMSAGALLGTIGFTFILLPSVAGVNLVLASILGFALSIPQMVVYTMMSRRFPRTGGDYVWISRTFGGFWGSTLSFMGYTLETMAYLALIVLSTVFAIGSVGLALGNGSFFGIAVPSDVPGSNPAAQFVVGAALFAILIGVNIAKPKAGYKLVSVITIVGVVTMAIAIITLLGAGRTGVVNYINGLGIKDTTYNSVAGSYSGPSIDFGATLFIMPLIAAFVYPWLNAAPAVASEIRGGRALKWNVPVSSIIVFLMLTTSLGTMYYVGGMNFVNSALANPTLVFNYSFNFWTLAMGVANNPALSLVIGIGWIAWNVGVLAYGIIVISRYLFAQAFDRFLPTKIAYVSPRFSSPVIAHLIDLVLTIALVGTAAFLYGSLLALFGAIVASMIYFVFVGLAATVYALRRERGGSRTVLATAGILNALVFLFLAYEFLAYPGVWGLNSLTYTYVAISFVAGAVIYLVSKRYHATRGINLSMAYKEIPPE